MTRLLSLVSVALLAASSTGLAQGVAVRGPSTPPGVFPADGTGLVRPEPTLNVLQALPPGLAALELEAAVGADVADARAALQDVVDDARRRVQGARGPQAVLGRVAEAVGAVCLALQDGREGWLFSDALRAGACDCDVLTLTYLTVADALGLPLAAAFLPDHVLLVWEEGGRRTYWETTLPGENPAWLVEARVPEGAGGAYLHPLTRTEMVGYLYLVRADHRHAQGDLRPALGDYDRATALWSSSPTAFHNRGRARLLAGDYVAAMADFDRALDLDPTYTDALYGRGLAHLLLGWPKRALSDFDGALAFEGAAADALHARGLALVALGRDAEAERSFTNALAADPTLLIALLDRAAVYERRGDADRARRDYLAFLGAVRGTTYEVDVPAVKERLGRLDSPAAGATRASG